ncbi:MAG: hypothetical protein EGP82_10175 [Odoribacter splanchnicus]|nr:hypothetical protein [Odoribacter splanchnicus]
MKREIQISNNLGEVEDMLHDWGILSVPNFCQKYNYNTEEMLSVLEQLISDYLILTEKIDKENIEGCNNWDQEYARAYHFI